MTVLLTKKIQNGTNVLLDVWTLVSMTRAKDNRIKSYLVLQTNEMTVWFICIDVNEMMFDGVFSHRLHRRLVVAA